MANTINCPVCGKLTDSRLDSCPHCGAYLKSRRQRHQASAAKPRKGCPRCGSPVEEGDIICVACGTNLLTGQKIVDEAALRRRRRKLPAGWLIGAGAAALLIVVIGVLWYYAAKGDPLSQARRLAAQDRPLEAQSILEEYIGRVPDDAPATLELARLHWRTEQFEKSAQAFAKAATLDPGNAEAAVFAARAAARSEKSSPRQLADLLARAVSLEPNDAGLWYTLALARGAAGDLPGEIEALERVVALRGTDDSAHWSLGVAYALSGNPALASTEFMTVASGPRKAEALAGLGFVALLQGNAAEAPRRLTEAVESGTLPSAAQAYIALGRMQLAQGAFAEAQGYLENALTAQPDNRQARFLRGLCLQARGRNQEALPDFEQLTSTPGDFSTEAAIQAANVHLAANAPDKARRALDPLARAGGKSAAFFAMQGRVALATGDDEGAFQSFDTAVRTDPAFAGAYLERGLLHIRREALGPGLADLDQYLKLVGDRGAGTSVDEVRALADQLRQAAQGAPGPVAAKEGDA